MICFKVHVSATVHTVDFTVAHVADREGTPAPTEAGTIRHVHHRPVLLAVLKINLNSGHNTRTVLFCLSI